jgi:hypothetical protein
MPSNIENVIQKIEYLFKFLSETQIEWFTSQRYSVLRRLPLYTLF